MSTPYSQADEIPGVYLSVAEDGVMHFFSNDQTMTAMCGKVAVSVDAGDDDSYVCGRCTAEALEVLGCPADMRTNILGLFDPVAKILRGDGEHK